LEEEPRQSAAGSGKGKAEYDKRDDIKKRESEAEMRRVMSRQLKNY
jgi:tmRNA-binding protein